MNFTVRAPEIESFDVIVVGRGPVGSTLANLLGLRGLKTLIFEREAAAYHLPRAVHFDDEVMRVFQAVELSEAVLPHLILSLGMHFVDSKGRLVLDWTRSKQITPMGWNLSYRFHQPDLEDVLNNGLARWPNVTVRTCHEVVALEDDASCTWVHYKNTETGSSSKARCLYVVGCDGARSVVRRSMDTPLIDLGFHERWLVVDVLLKRDRPDLGDYAIQYCNPERPVTYVRGTGNRRRWEITIFPDEDSGAATDPARVWQLLKPWINEQDADIERASVYTFHSTIAESWRNGRWMIAGDSAHQTPPFLGQGMCAGIRDAANLAWKLERVIRGQDSEALLDTYQSERLPHVREFIELAIRLGGLINTKAMEAGIAAGVKWDNGPAKLEVEKPLLGPGLAAGDTRLTGRLAPQFILSDGTRSDDRTGYTFVLLATSTFAAQLKDSERATLARIGAGVLDDSESALQNWLLLHGIHAAMVRPDRYILGAVKSDGDLLAILSLFDHEVGTHIA